MDLDKVYMECLRFGLAGKKEDWMQSVYRGILNIDAILQQIKMTKEQKVLEVHKTAISQLENGRWQTTVKDDTKSSGRREIKLSTYEKVIDRLYDFYFTNIDNLRLHDIFEDWLVYKCKKNGNKEATKKQNRASYNKYVCNKKIDLIPLKKITTMDLEDWAIDVLTEYSMTSNIFNTHKTVVMNALVYAKKKGYISNNPWVKEELDYQRLLDSPRRKASSDMVFYPDEIDSLVEEFERCYELNSNTANLALEINFDLGLRIGELCAIKWTDVDWKNETIFIQRMEDSTGKVVEYVKADSEAGYRELALTSYALKILKRIRQNSRILSEFIFCDEFGTRKTKLQMLNRLRRAEKSLGWENIKCSHCIRRTVASRMDANHIALDEIRRWLGHTDTRTTLMYIFNPYREDKTRELIKNCSILSTNKECLQLSTKNHTNSENKKRLNA